ncbi:SPFH domain-containing protein [Schlesneria paludicola]|uniref:SPFH domain-containing protein n=1 Tax=Schlesneria paludicola TaxID=360056 RepID=UPI00029A8306|nr:SPFH domain-containing protein [Schlesneria paludicola]
MSVFMSLGVGVGAAAVAAMFLLWLVVRYIPNDKVGIVEKLWSAKGSLGDGDIVALSGEAGFQPNVLRGGLHFGYWRWQFAVHKRPLMTVTQGKLAYVFARAGEALGPSQTLGRVVACNHYQDVRTFLQGGQKGRQRAILREGVYAINLAVFNIIREDGVFSIDNDRNLSEWQQQLLSVDGFSPVVIGSSSGSKSDDIGIVTTQDGPSLQSGEIIAPPVGNEAGDENYHNNYQDIEAFLRAGGRRGKQYAPLLDGTYFINRWFASIEHIPKEVVNIGEVGVVVSYYGKQGSDTSGVQFRHGERVHQGERGVWETTLGPGKYPFNTYAGQIIRVPTTNFVLHWITGKSEGHKYDESLKSIDLITKDAYEPILPLSVVVHIDYQKAPNVIQRFGDVKKLITQTIDPMLSAYFRDVAHKKTMLELVHSRDEIQQQARSELKAKFEQFDIGCVDVLIGKPESKQDDGKIENLLEQLRLRQLSLEQIETYGKQEQAAEKKKSLNDANAKAEMQEQLTQSSIKIAITTNQAEADLAKARKDAERRVVTARAESESISLEGQGQSQKVNLVGSAEADVLLKKVASYGDPKLYALSVVAQALSKSEQPLVPATMLSSGGDGTQIGMLGTLMSLLVAEKIGVNIGPQPPSADFTIVEERNA